MKIIVKLIFSIIILSTILVYGQGVQATLTFDEIQQQAESFLNRVENPPISIEEAKTQLFPVGGIMIGIATAIFIVVGLIMGVKYMLSGADEKAKLKERLIWYVIAVIMAYGAVGLYNLAVTIMQGVIG